MVTVSYHVSQEQFDPSRLLRLAVQAERAGFDAAFSSDHLQPWAPRQGHSAFTWSWLGAALQATTRLAFGTITVPGGWRYTPVVLAQAIGTLARMYPGRLPWVALGSGEAINETLVGAGWPAKDERNRRLASAALSIRRLLDGERVTQHGAPAVADARLWCRPAQPVRLVGAALTEDTARWMGAWADGLLTTAPSAEAAARVIRAYREGGGDGPVYLKADLCWAPRESDAVREAITHWRFTTVGARANANLRQPEHFDAATRDVTEADIRQHVFVSSDLDAHVAHLQACVALGVAGIDLHHVGVDQEGFVDTFGRAVVPRLHAAG